METRALTGIVNELSMLAKLHSDLSVTARGVDRTWHLGQAEAYADAARMVLDAVVKFEDCR